MDTVFVIRHAEKPDSQTQGVNEQGAIDADSLSPRGWQRAGALTVFFGSRQMLIVPDRIYASAPGKRKTAANDKDGITSKRPLETIAPLAAKLQKVPITIYGKGEEIPLAKEVEGLTGSTLICWQHEAIPTIARLLAGTVQGIPATWPSDRFDVVWCLTRNNAGDTWSFSQVCQCLLAGDRSDPVAGD